MEGPTTSTTATEDAEVTSTSESPSAVYSPHTQGFPPSSHPPQPSNPFSSASAKKGWPEVKGPAMTSSVSTSFLRPSKLEAGLGTNIFLTKQPVPSPQEVKVDESKQESKAKSTPTEAGEGSEAESPTPTTTSSEEQERKDKDPDSSEATGVQEPAEGATAGKCKEETADKEQDGKTVTTTAEEPKPKKETLSYHAPPPVGFVFGSNLNDRVENVSKGVSNGDGHEKTAEKLPGSSGSPESGKRKWDATCPATTGEENESNVMQASCRLFAFDVENSNWIERGRGQLRLNDRQEGDVLHSRLIVRTKGSLRLMLNTPVFPQMVIERSSEKCVKITGHEDGGGSGVKLFLIQCSPSEADTLHSALEWRLRSIQSLAASAEEEATKDGSRGEECSISESKLSVHEAPVDSAISPPKKPKLSP